jgi:hypothetical protein
LKQNGPFGTCTINRLFLLGSFGTATERIAMPFKEFLHQVKSTSQLYLTTQYETPSAQVQDPTKSQAEQELEALLASVFPPPLPPLLNDLSSIPPWILPTLVPQQLNFWIGQAPQGASSGLHHDYADNLYLLLKGKKRFTLFSPKDTAQMRLFGQPKRVARNGLIVYEADIRDDGAYARHVAQWKVKQAQQQLEALESRTDASPEAIQAAEDALDDALLGVVDYDEDLEMEEEQASDNTIGHPITHDNPTTIPKSEPPSFSQWPNAVLHSSDSLPPELSTATRMACTLEAGDLLYLPASWFHEVTSYSSPEEVHMALNFWFHPPTTTDFKQPYEDPYWASQWKQCESVLHSEAWIGKVSSDS